MTMYRGRVTRVTGGQMYYEVPDLAVGYEFGPEAAIEGVVANDNVLLAQVGDTKEDVMVATAATHKHDSRYYTKAQVDAMVANLQAQINTKADASHTHA